MSAGFPVRRDVPNANQFAVPYGENTFGTASPSISAPAAGRDKKESILPACQFSYVGEGRIFSSPRLSAGFDVAFKFLAISCYRNLTIIAYSKCSALACCRYIHLSGKDETFYRSALTAVASVAWRGRENIDQ
jgi:hypothetical protein